MIHEVLEALGLDIPIAGLAKDDRHRTAELYCGYPPLLVGVRPHLSGVPLSDEYPGGGAPLCHFVPPPETGKAFIHSELEGIEGIGAKTIETLLRHFRTVEKVRAANWEELSALIGPAKARKVRGYFEGAK